MKCPVCPVIEKEIEAVADHLMAAHRWTYGDALLWWKGAFEISTLHRCACEECLWAEEEMARGNYAARR